MVTDLREVAPVFADETRLEQVFVNPLINPAQAMAMARSAENQIRVATGHDDRGNVVIELEDTGSGIPEDILPKIAVGVVSSTSTVVPAIRFDD